MTRLIVIKCKEINDFVGLLNAASKDDLGYGVDLENNTIFTSDIEIMTKNLGNLYTNSCLEIRRFVVSGFGTISITCQYGTVEIPGSMFDP